MQGFAHGFASHAIDGQALLALYRIGQSQGFGFDALLSQLGRICGGTSYAGKLRLAGALAELFNKGPVN